MQSASQALHRIIEACICSSKPPIFFIWHYFSTSPIRNLPLFRSVAIYRVGCVRGPSTHAINRYTTKQGRSPDSFLKNHHRRIASIGYSSAVWSKKENPYVLTTDLNCSLLWLKATWRQYCKISQISDET